MSTDSVRIAEAMPDYEVQRELGRGGMGVVFLGRHKRLDRGVAIKELPPTFASEPEVRERFSTEARTLAGLSHPHIVPIFDYVERDGLCLIVMEQLPGGTVWDRFTTTGLTPPTACAVVMACCAALQHAHSKGVLHLDVKPDNLMFDAESAVKVTDFGIAKVLSGDRTLGTVDGQVLGTPAYMSPEQARGEPLTAASDVYAAGVMLYELLSGQLPWQGAETAADLLSQRLREDPTPLREVAPHVPQPLADVVMKALSRGVEARYQHAVDLGVAIGEACADSWGPEWLDHAGVAIVGSEKLSRAARTTSHGTAPLAEPPASTAPTEARTGTSDGRANETITRGAAHASGAGSTVVTGGTGTATPGAAETGVVGRPVVDDPARARETAVPGSPAPAAPDGAHETIARGPAGPPSAPATGAVAPAGPAGPVPPVPPAPAAPVTQGPGSAPQFQVVRAASAQPRILGADLYDLELADLIGVEDVLDPPKPPWPAILVTALVFAAALVVALVGLASPSRSGDLKPGQVELAGVDVASGERIDLDLSGDVAVRVTDPALAASADAVELQLSYVGIPVTTVDAPLDAGSAAVDPGIGQRTIGGAASAVVVLKSGEDDVAEHEVGIDATQTWYLTAPFVLGVLILLLALANLETSLKPLRSGHRRFLSYVGAFIWGGLGGIGLVVLSGALGFSEPTVVTAVVVAALGALSGVAAARARIGIARRRRVRKAVKRAEKTLGVRATTG